MQWFTSGRLDCMAPDRERGLRCTTPEDASDYDYSDHSQCVPMQCASTGGAPQVLVNGEPCDPRAPPRPPRPRPHMCLFLDRSCSFLNSFQGICFY